jgi:hypothetical protein
MTNIAPVLRIAGRVRQARERTVPAVPAAPERRDENGRITHVAREARPSYLCHDITVDTDPGGLVTIVFRPEAISDAGGFLPTVGDVIDVPVRAFDSWQGSPSRRYRVNGYSFAGAVYTAQAAARVGSRAAEKVPA